MKSIQAVLYAAGLCTLAGCGRESATASIEAKTDTGKRAPIVAVARAGRHALAKELTLSAEFRPYQEVELHAKVAGYLKTITVDVGDRVRAGQLLATLEVPEMAEDLSQASANRKRSEAEVQRAHEELTRAEFSHQNTHQLYQRLASVRQSRPNLIAQQEIDDAQSRDRVAEAQVSAARASLAAAEQQVEAATSGVNRVKTMNEYMRITAPFAGLITKRYADPGAMIQAGTASQTQAMPVVRLSQVDRLRLVLPVPESVVPQLRVGSPVSVRVSALDRSFAGRVSRTAGKIVATTRTMETEVDVPNPKGVLTPGMYADATLTLEQAPQALAVPVQAIADQGDKASVMVVTPEKRVEERSVKLGLETAEYRQILDGVREGELVVTGNRSQLKAGQVVEPKVVALSGMKE